MMTIYNRKFLIIAGCILFFINIYGITPFLNSQSSNAADGRSSCASLFNLCAIDPDIPACSHKTHSRPYKACLLGTGVTQNDCDSIFTGYCKDKEQIPFCKKIFEGACLNMIGPDEAQCLAKAEDVLKNKCAAGETEEVQANNVKNCICSKTANIGDCLTGANVAQEINEGFRAAVNNELIKQGGKWSGRIWQIKCNKFMGEGGAIEIGPLITKLALDDLISTAKAAIEMEKQKLAFEKEKQEQEIKYETQKAELEIKKLETKTEGELAVQQAKTEGQQAVAEQQLKQTVLQQKFQTEQMKIQAEAQKEHAELIAEQQKKDRIAGVVTGIIGGVAGGVTQGIETGNVGQGIAAGVSQAATGIQGTTVQSPYQQQQYTLPQVQQPTTTGTTGYNPYDGSSGGILDFNL